MSKVESLKQSRNLLLKLHKVLVDYEREAYEAFNGKKTSTEFLSLLLNDSGLEWLRRFSTLIVDIDEMFAQKDGFSEEQIDAHLGRMQEMLEMNGEDESFLAKYQTALQNDPDAAALHAEIKRLFQ
jgi:hypothetical protein